MAVINVGLQQVVKVGDEKFRIVYDDELDGNNKQLALEMDEGDGNWCTVDVGSLQHCVTAMAESIRTALIDLVTVLDD